MTFATKDAWVSWIPMGSNQFHPFIRTQFLQYPILNLGNGDVQVPHPDLLLRHTLEGVHRLARDVSGFDNEFGDAFQTYVGKLARWLEPDLILNDRQLEQESSERSCDYLLQLGDEIVLVECKATVLAARLLFDRTLLNDTSTGMVAKGLSQVYSTARDIRDGRFQSLGVRAELPARAIVVTFGDLPFPNGDWYFSNYLAARAEKMLSRKIFPAKNIVGQPIILSIEAFEKWASALNHLSLSPSQLSDKKNECSYMEVGDWDTYLSGVLRESNVRLPSFVHQNVDDFIGRLSGELTS